MDALSHEMKAISSTLIIYLLKFTGDFPDISQEASNNKKVKKVYNIVQAFYYGMGINVTTKKKEKQRDTIVIC